MRCMCHIGLVGGWLLLLPVVTGEEAAVSAEALLQELPEEQVPLSADLSEQLELLREAMACMEFLPEEASGQSGALSPAYTVRLMVDKWILPRWRVLRVLSNEELLRLVLLADAIDWQGAWVRDCAVAESCVPHPLPERPTCLERLTEVAQELEQLLVTEKDSDVAVELRRFFEVLGGVQVLRLPKACLEQRLCQDYKTVYDFFSLFRSALESEDEGSMAELKAYTDYLLQSEADVIRVNALAREYVGIILEEYRVRPPRYRISPAMRELAMVHTSRLPELRRLFFRQENAE